MPKNHTNIADLLKMGLVLQLDGSWKKPIRVHKSNAKPQTAQSIKGREIVAQAKKKHKYGAVSRVVDGIRWDSNREYEFSKLLKLNGIAFETKKRFVLQEKFRYCGEGIREIVIIPDFLITGAIHPLAIVDVKGMETQLSKLKFKLLLAKLKITGKEIPLFRPKNKIEMNDAINEILILLK